jgi:hypothetical protein
MNKTILASVGIIAALALVGYAVSKPAPAPSVAGIGQQGIQGEAGAQGPQGPQGAQGIQGPRGLGGSAPVRTVGSLAGPDISSPYLNINGYRFWPHNQGFVLATTTVCAIQAPAATSTLLVAAATVTTASSTATVFTFAKANTQYATTTSLGQFLSAANGQGSATASTSPGNLLDSNLIFSPNQWLVIGEQGGNGGAAGSTFNSVGRCIANFAEIPNTN